jgi:septal ring factor EnvC (AmiA/AmiB activator)
MKCTLPEPDRSGWDNRDYYEDTIDELWEVLRLVESLRNAEKEAAKVRRSLKSDGERMAELHDTIHDLRKEIDEWFKDLNNEEQ